jgi:hypothetical protein
MLKHITFRYFIYYVQNWVLLIAENGFFLLAVTNNRGLFFVSQLIFFARENLIGFRQEHLIVDIAGNIS